MKSQKRISSESIESVAANAFMFVLLGIVVYAVSFMVYRLASGTAGAVSIGV